MNKSTNYGHTQVPTNLFLCLDNNCRSTLFSLIQLSSYYANDDGWFFRTNSDLQAETKLSINVLNGALDALYQKGIIDIIPQAKGRGCKQVSRKYKVNTDTFAEYDKLGIEDCMKNPDYAIETRNYKHGAPSFQRASQPSSLQTSPQTSKPSSLQSENNIDNIENRDNTENKEVIYNTVYIIEEPNGNRLPDGDCSISSLVEGSNTYPADNSEPDGNRTTSLSLPTCSLSSSHSFSSTSYSPKGESSNPEKLKQQIIPRDKEISSQQPSDTNASEGTVSVSVPSQFKDGDSCAQTGIQDDEIRLIQALDVLYRYDKNHLRFDAVSKQARNDATMLAMKCNGWDFSTAKAWVQEQRKENLENIKKNPKQDDSNPSIPVPKPEDEEAQKEKLLDEARAQLEIVVEYDLNHTPQDGMFNEAHKKAIHLLMNAYNCTYNDAWQVIQDYRREEIEKAEVAKAAAILNDDPEPKPDYGVLSKMIVDVDALDGDDYDCY